MTSMNLNAVTDDNVKRGGDDVQKNDPVSVHHLEVNLRQIDMVDLNVKDSSGVKFAFHEKKARELEGCHLGGGSFGEVFKAVHEVHGDVAVKLAKPGKGDQLKMCQKEARKLGLSLTCDYIVAIKGFVKCEEDACPCGLLGIVMQYMENGSLWDFRISEWQHSPDLWPLTNRMVYEISCGMNFLHSEKIVHRDLKLENVLVDDDLHVKIADLGLATNPQSSSGDRCAGTDSHKPPEAFRTDLPNSTKVTPKHDVYSFAMTLYELLTGIHPYSDRGFDMMKLLKVEEKQPPCLQPVPVNAPKDLIEVMKECWSYEANERPNFIEIKVRVKRLGIKPTHDSLGLYFGERKSSKKEGNTNDEPVSRDAQKVPIEPSTDEVDNPSSARNHLEREEDFDDILRNVARLISNNTQIDFLGKALGFDPDEIERYIATNTRSQHVTYEGTLKMLRDWRYYKTDAIERPALADALKLAGLRDMLLRNSKVTDLLTVSLNLKSGITEASLVNKNSTSPRPVASTVVDTLPQGASAAVGEVPTSTARKVSDAMLNDLARTIPGRNYDTFSERLGVEHNQARNILERYGNNYEKATRDCMAIWKDRSTRSVADLHEVLRKAELGGLIVNYNYDQ